MKKEVEQAIIKEEKEAYKENTMSFIMDIVAAYYKQPLDVYTYNSRKEEVVTTKYTAIYLIKKHLKNITLAAIGEKIGGKTGYNHATVLHAIKKIEGLLKWDDITINQVEEIDRMIRMKQTTFSYGSRLDGDYYMIYMDKFVSLRTNSQRAVVLVGYSDEEISGIQKTGNVIVPKGIKAVAHDNMGWYLMKKKRNEGR